MAMNFGFSHKHPQTPRKKSTSIIGWFSKILGWRILAALEKLPEKICTVHSIQKFQRNRSSYIQNCFPSSGPHIGNIKIVHACCITGSVPDVRSICCDCCHASAVLHNDSKQMVTNTNCWNQNHTCLLPRQFQRCSAFAWAGLWCQQSIHQNHELSGLVS